MVTCAHGKRGTEGTEAGEVSQETRGRGTEMRACVCVGLWERMYVHTRAHTRTRRHQKDWILTGLADTRPPPAPPQYPQTPPTPPHAVADPVFPRLGEPSSSRGSGARGRGGVGGSAPVRDGQGLEGRESAYRGGGDSAYGDGGGGGDDMVQVCMCRDALMPSCLGLAPVVLASMQVCSLVSRCVGGGAGCACKAGLLYSLALHTPCA